MEKILIIDDEPAIRSLLARIIGLEGYEVSQAQSCEDGLVKTRKLDPDVVICDVFLPDGNGIDFIRRLKEVLPDGEIIMLTAHGNISDGVQAIKNGAFDYITKGDDNDKIIPLLSRAMSTVKQRKRESTSNDLSKLEYDFNSIISISPEISKAVTLARKVAVTDVPVLLTGETGTGKEVFARAIHANSKRSKGEFVAVNCSAFSKELLESEMFGYKAGAFTGALKDKKGLFEVANHGTIFLDEVGEMALELQAKLLRILESGEYIKVGDTKATSVDVRIIAATNRNLTEAIEQNKFRSDLFYRLSVFQIQLPSLRERVEDIKALAENFINRYSLQFKLSKVKMSPSFLKALQHYSWPGNIRELRNAIERSLIVCNGEELQLSDLPLDIQDERFSSNSAVTEFDMATMEKHHIIRVLQHTKGNKTEAARLLKIGLTTLYRKIEEYGI